MFNFKKKLFSLSQLKKKKRDLNKSIEITNLFSMKMIFIALAIIIASTGIELVYNVEFLALCDNIEIAHRDIISTLYVISQALQFMGLGLATSAVILCVSNIFGYNSLRKTTKAIESHLSTKTELTHD